MRKCDIDYRLIHYIIKKAFPLNGERLKKYLYDFTTFYIPFSLPAND